MRFVRMRAALGIFIPLLGMVFSLSSYGAQGLSSEASTPKQIIIKKIRYKKVTELEFEDSLIKGKLVRPDGALLLHKNEDDASHWMKLKSSFGERVVRSARSLK